MSSYTTATLKDLRADANELRCDVCHVELAATDFANVAGFQDQTDLPAGLLLWHRGDHRDREDVPLCPNCGTAIGVAVFQRMQMDEEEG